ncbi:hypothetical protein HZH66_000632 [Vespula vulgaris]|uniref:Uncharacterized protein n=1 Tax=Vespula vulgaris TaxID=7454 RepID=A0A834KX56_VESVU|nr:hypothetical protein HZH66_000632 [Vespula vulgaris]
MECVPCVPTDSFEFSLAARDKAEIFLFVTDQHVYASTYAITIATAVATTGTGTSTSASASAGASTGTGTGTVALLLFFNATI